MCIKYLANYIKYDFSESEDIRHKKAIFIWRDNALLSVKYRDTCPEVNMYLLNTYCCHFYRKYEISYINQTEF